MIQAFVVLDEDACIVSLAANGHATGAPLGSNAACAALSVLFEAAFMALSGCTGLIVEGDAEIEGEARFSVRRLSEEYLGEQRGISNFLRAGLRALEEDFPGQIEIDIR
jgi:uncharacterized protein YsxB (DUF464 family)